MADFANPLCHLLLPPRTGARDERAELTRDFLQVPQTDCYVIANATVPAVLCEAEGPLPDAGDGLIRADIEIRNGAIAGLAAPADAATRLPVVDMDGGMVWPCLVDMHTHID